MGSTLLLSRIMNPTSTNSHSFLNIDDMIGAWIILKAYGNVFNSSKYDQWSLSMPLSILTS